MYKYDNKIENTVKIFLKDLKKWVGNRNTYIMN